MNKVEQIQEIANTRVGEIFDLLDIEYIENSDYIQCACPVHGSDNSRSLYWAFKSNHWKCLTRNCHQDPVTGKSTSIFGLVRGIMHNKYSKAMSFNETVDFVSKLLNINQTNLSESTQQDIEITKIIKRYKNKINKTIKPGYTLLRDVLPNLKKDSYYYPNRGVSQEIIDKYHISYCDNPKKLFYQRAFFPILDENNKFVVGWSGRSIFNKCNNKKCKLYHDANTNCPSDGYKWKYGKWMHSKGFKSEQHLYNLGFSKRFINKNGIAIVCESPGNVWAYENVGLNNSVAVMGCSISKHQRQLLQKAGALTLVITLDNDEAGLDAEQRFKELLEHYFRLIFIYPDGKNDVAEMLPDEIKNKIGSIINQESYIDVLKDRYGEVVECQ